MSVRKQQNSKKCTKIIKRKPYTWTILQIAAHKDLTNIKYIITIMNINFGFYPYTDVC